MLLFARGRNNKHFTAYQQPKIELAEAPPNSRQATIQEEAKISLQRKRCRPSLLKCTVRAALCMATVLYPKRPVKMNWGINRSRLADGDRTTNLQNRIQRNASQYEVVMLDLALPDVRCGNVRLVLPQGVHPVLEPVKYIRRH